MGVEVFESSLESNDVILGDDIFEDDNVRSLRGDTDARRRLEDKLEELRLRRELREFDFDA